MIPVTGAPTRGPGGGDHFNVSFPRHRTGGKGAVMVFCGESVLTETTRSFEELVEIVREEILSDCPLVSELEAENEAREIVTAACDAAK